MSCVPRLKNVPDGPAPTTTASMGFSSVVPAAPSRTSWTVERTPLICLSCMITIKRSIQLKLFMERVDMSSPFKKTRYAQRIGNIAPQADARHHVHGVSPHSLSLRYACSRVQRYRFRGFSRYRNNNLLKCAYASFNLES